MDRYPIRLRELHLLRRTRRSTECVGGAAKILMAFLYVLKSCIDNKLYVGSTRQTLEQRIRRHNNGQVDSTRNRRPFILLHSESFKEYSNARKRELYLKTGSGREHLNRILINRTGTQAAKGGRL